MSQLYVIRLTDSAHGLRRVMVFCTMTRSRGAHDVLPGRDIWSTFGSDCPISRGGGNAAR
jgi:hypothetical protein